jgi:hypothetical protein
LLLTWEKCEQDKLAKIGNLELRVFASVFSQALLGLMYDV